MQNAFPVRALKPHHTDIKQLDTELQAEAAQRWQDITDRHSLAVSPQQKATIMWLLAVSPFIGRVLLAYGQDTLVHLLQPQGFSQSHVHKQVLAAETEAQAMHQIRRLRRLEMARIASLDLTGELALHDSLQANTHIADYLITAACLWSQRQLTERHGQALSSSGKEQRLWVIAMGKLGGAELNFSSDIDLIFCFEQQGETQGGRRPLDHQVYFTKIAQQTVRLLEQVTVDGRAFRVDLRLRPFGQSGAVVTSLAALEDYYQEQGRNWERYAMVKSRVISYPDSKGEEHACFAQLIRPFVYRRYLDYSAIDALRKMKLLINQEARRLGKQLNVKLGVGGIREIEFVAQVFQLIRGGREPEFQTRSLVEALQVAQQFKVLEEQVVSELLDCYAWLRKLEHAIQQINDEQTQSLPSNLEDQARLVAICGAQSWTGLLDDFAQVTGKAHQAFLDVIGGEAEMMNAEDSEFALLWQDLIDPEIAIRVLEEAGAEEPEKIWQRIRDFREQARRRSSGPRGRELLGILVPQLIEALVTREQTDEVLQRVFTVLEQVVSRTTYLELLAGNQGAREQLVFLCAASPWVASLIARLPLLLDELIDPEQLYDLPDPTTYKQEVAEQLNRLAYDDPEVQMDALRQVKQVFQLRVAAADLSDGVPLTRVSDHLTYLAEAMTEQVVLMAWRQLAERHGVPAGKDESDMGFAVIAYGKLGGYELGYGSDLDLVFLSEDGTSGMTDGVKPIDAQQFYLRLAQRILHLFTTRSLQGVLYEVDMRLRPSGQSGLMVVRESTYAQYLNEEAWIWELQALVRARLIFGTEQMATRFQDTRNAVLRKSRETRKLQHEVVAMRKKMREQFSAKHQGAFDIKNDAGGMIDIEFMTQYLVLSQSFHHPSLTDFPDNIRVLTKAAAAGLLAEEQVSGLITAYTKFREEAHRLSLAEQGSVSPKSFTPERKLVQKLWLQLLGEKLSS
ncbi:bifunctional [glutamate--ammonia ligase]-adenylyl-L-tyrosine phosphorylase/[glutamate--ammonia-ligase] adenylyltransferase [Aliidiomarina taiwanensis]|nr:bifunctional [glutamate--ammonia ligase]-adenylyl-L-tyrosine phosphorylase/[glutamate--ammonia-ligase] adenylyltransferase [Aliidiomarina taiwanensis]